MSRMIGLEALSALAAAGSARAAPAGFKTTPTAERRGDKTIIRFAVDQPTDVEVAILDAKGQVVRHLAAGDVRRRMDAR